MSSIIDLIPAIGNVLAQCAFVFLLFALIVCILSFAAALIVKVIQEIRRHW